MRRSVKVRHKRWRPEDIVCSCGPWDSEPCVVHGPPESRAPWICKDGTQVRIEEMTDAHLMNAIKLLERFYACTVGGYMLGPEPRGEMAQDAFEQEFDALCEAGPEALAPQYDVLVEEAERRGLDTEKQRQQRRCGGEMVVLDYVVKAKAERKYKEAKRAFEQAKAERARVRT
jgi:hypothetical protein